MGWLQTASERYYKPQATTGASVKKAGVQAGVATLAATAISLTLYFSDIKTFDTKDNTVEDEAAIILVLAALTARNSWSQDAKHRRSIAAQNTQSPSP